MTITEELRGKIIVSSQAMPGEPFYNEDCMKAMISSVVNGGASALRVAGVRDIKLAKNFNLPVIGITKPDKLPDNWRSVVYITPTISDIEKIINAGADIVAFDGTARKRPDNSSVKDIVEKIHSYSRLAMADISTIDEAISCDKFGVDIISTTLAGYTDESGVAGNSPDYKLLANIVKVVQKPVILEGRIWTPEDVKKAFELGAHCVVIGSAITRPHLITKRFVEWRCL